MNPDEIAWAINFSNTFGECCVRLFVERVVSIRRRIFCGDILPEQIVE